MITILKKLFGIGPKINFAELLKADALIVDVRSKAEFASGNIKGALNISLDQLTANLGKLKDKNRTIITCCASGMRSASAKGILKANGYTQVINGGGWVSLQSKINKNKI